MLQVPLPGHRRSAGFSHPSTRSAELTAEAFHPACGEPRRAVASSVARSSQPPPPENPKSREVGKSESGGRWVHYKDWIFPEKTRFAPTKRRKQWKHWKDWKHWMACSKTRICPRRIRSEKSIAK